MALEIRLLGPIEAFRDGVRLDLKGGRQRALLAYLSLTPGVPRNVDGMIEALWPDTQPVEPRQAVHTYASRLRAVLGPDIVLARDGGYEVAVPSHDVDASAFEELVRRAGVGSVAPEQRLTLLDESLAHWRGAALDGLQHEEWARGHAVRLEELRAHAGDERARLLLDTGRAAEAIADLEAAVLRSPLRERTHAVLMLALHQTGRQAEALRIFQTYRQRLSTDLGLDPSADITELERSIAGQRRTPDVAGNLSIGQSAQTARSWERFEQIGEGSSAVVYRGKQPSVDREVAIKVIRAELANRAEFIRRFEAEAHLVANLEHPHIVPLYDYWREPGSACLVMRLFREGTVETMIADRPFDVEAVVRLVRQVGEALAVAHRNGVVHRDVKPANLFVDSDQNFFLGDFGIAHGTIGPGTANQAVSLGSPGYAAPEQLRREPVGPGADIHGLAITVFECLTGHMPFRDATTHDELLRRQLNDPLPSVHADRPGLPVAIDDVLTKATAKDPNDRYPSVGEFVVAFTSAAVGPAAAAAVRQRGAVSAADMRNPYKGLLAFQEADAGDFFGRHRLVQRIVSHLRTAGPAGRLALIVGPSGSGKSSVVRAGLLPALRHGALPGSQRWLYTSMMPGAFPFEELEAALHRVAVTHDFGTADIMARNERGVAVATKRVVGAELGEIVLVIDQFEELFTLCSDTAVRNMFLASLVNAITDTHSRLRVVATLRADFYDRPLRHPGLAKLLEASSITVTPLAPDELERAIAEPAAQVGAVFEPGLVSRIVGDVLDQPGALPLLQFGLTELFDTQASGMMTMAAYDKLGGLTGALARRGEQIYVQATTDVAREAIRQVFTRLVTLGDGTEDTRRRVRRSELGVAPDVQAVIDSYGTARLLAFDRDPRSREQTIEVAHEALLREWPRLRDWLDSDRDGLRLHRQLTTAAEQWADSGHDASELFRGAKLETVQTWAATHEPDMNETEAAFVSASAARHANEIAAEQRAARRLRRLLAAVACVAALATVAGALAWKQQRTAERSRRVAESATAVADQAKSASETRRIAALAPTITESDLSLAMLLAAEADRRSSTPETLGALQRVLVAADTNLGFISTNEAVEVAGFDSRGDIVAVSSTGVTVWDHDTHQPTKRIAVQTAGFDLAHVNRHAVVRGDQLVWLDAAEHLWRASLGGGSAGPLPVGEVADFALDATGATLFVVRRGGDVISYSLPNLATNWSTAGDGRTKSADFGADGGDAPVVISAAYDTERRQLIVTHGSDLFIHDASTGSIMDRLSPMDPLVKLPYVYVSRATTALPGSPRRIGVVNGISLSILDMTTKTANTVADLTFITSLAHDVAATAEEVYVMNTSGEITVVAASTGKISRSFNAKVGTATGLLLSPDGHSLIASGDRGLAIHALDSSSLLRRTIARPAELNGALSLSPDGSVLILDEIGNSYGLPEPSDILSGVWQCARSPQPCRRRTDVPALPKSNLFAGTPDVLERWEWGEGEAPSTRQLFDVTTGLARSEPIRLGARGMSGSFLPRSLAWIASAPNPPAGGSIIEIRALPSARPIADIRLDAIVGIAGPPEPTRLLLYDHLTGDSQTLRTDTWQLASSPLGPGEALTAMFSIDGRFLVTTNRAGQIVLRHADSYAVIRTLVGDGKVGSFQTTMAISDDSKYLITSADQRARLWDLATGSLIGAPFGPPKPAALPAAVGGKHPWFLTATDHWIELWTLDPTTWQTIACRAAGRNMTADEWQRYGPADQPHRKTCPEWPGPTV